MDVFQTLKKSLCIPSLKSRKKHAVIEEIAEVLAEQPEMQGISAKEIAKGFTEREMLGSTGFGGGLAIPHCKFKGIDKFFVGLAVSRRGVNFEAIDNRKVHLFCFIVGPEDQPQGHVKLLAEVSLVLREESVRRALIAAPTQTALFEEFTRHCMGECKEISKERKLLVLVVQGEDMTLSIIELFVELGLRGASVIESTSMGRMLSKIPLFADFINFLGSQGDYHRTILTTIPADEADDIVAKIEAITGDLDKHSGAMLMILDVPFMKGSLEAI